ncbi:MAG: ABC transporter permease [bacterium]
MNKKLSKIDISDLFEKVELSNDESEKLAVEPYSYWKSVFKIFFRSKVAIIALVTVISTILCAIFIPIFMPLEVGYDLSNKLASPSLQHWFGTDNIGADLFRKVWVAAQKSLGIAAIVAVINAVNGIVIGACWGYFRKLDPIMVEVYNFITNIPSLLLYMLILLVLSTANKTSSEFNLIFAMTITGWIGLARFIRNQIIIIGDREYNLASKTLGSSPITIIVHNLLPFILPVIITSISMSIPAVIGNEVGLSYFGLGLESTAISLGRVLTAGYADWVDFPHVLLFPALILGVITVSFYLMGQVLSDALDPKTHR